MEIIAIIVAAIIVMWWVNAFKTVGNLIAMGNAEIDQLTKDQFTNHIDRSKKRNLKQADVEKALTNDAMIEQYMDSVK